MAKTIRRDVFTRQQKVTIRKEILDDPEGLGYRTQSGELMEPSEIVSILARRRPFANPKPQPNVPAPVDKDYVLDLLERYIDSFPDGAILRVSALAEAQDRNGLKRWTRIALRRSWIPKRVHDELMAHLSAVRPDPDWKPQLPGRTRLEEVLGLEQGQDPGISAAEIDEILGRV